mgnify:CR=1 FL=1
MSNAEVNANANEKVARKDVLKEIYTDMAKRLTDKELFILMHLANIRAAYDQVKTTMSITEETASQLSFDGSDIANNIAANIHQNPQVVRHLVYALYLMGLVEKRGMKNNSQSWFVTNAGGQVLNIVMESEENVKDGKTLTERYSFQVNKTKGES